MLNYHFDCIQDEHGILLTDDSNIANEFNTKFINVEKELADHLFEDPNFTQNTAVQPDSLALAPTDANDLNTLIPGLKDKKSLGIDGIKAEMLKFIYFNTCSL